MARYVFRKKPSRFPLQLASDHHRGLSQPTLHTVLITSIWSFLILESHPAVDDELGTNDIGTSAGAQVKDGLGDLVPFREALDQDLILYPSLSLFELCLRHPAAAEQGAFDRSRANRVHPDAATGEFCGHRFRQADDRGFCRTINSRPRHPFVSVDRSI